MTKLLLPVVLTLVVTSASVAKTWVSPETLLNSGLISMVEDKVTENRLSLIPLPASTLFDNALAIDTRSADEADVSAVIRINRHNLMHYDARLVDFVRRVA